MNDAELIARYNYDTFVPENFGRWLNFDASPPLGEVAPDFPLWELDNNETRLSAVWSQYTYTVVEFGSFT